MVGNPLIHLRKNDKGAVFLAKNSNKYPYLQNVGQNSHTQIHDFNLIRLQVIHICFRSFSVFPIFPTQNKGVQLGHYGEESNLTIYIYKQDAFKSIKKHGETLNLKIKKKKVKTSDSFHGINIMVFAMEYLIHLPAATEEDFTNYTIEACNHKSCNSFIVELKSASK